MLQIYSTIDPTNLFHKKSPQRISTKISTKSYHKDSLTKEQPQKRHDAKIGAMSFYNAYRS